MGCDIHLHVEIKRKNRDLWYSSPMGGEFSSRVYGMFAVLSNVRNYWGLDRMTIDRGFPDDAAYSTIGKYYLTILPDEEFKKIGDYEWACSESDVIRWGEEIKEIAGNNYCVGPDWHSPNWCTVQELSDCIDEVFVDEYTDEYVKSNYIIWLSLLNYMKTYEDSGLYDVRAVYWFDN